MKSPMQILCASLAVDGGNPYVRSLAEALEAEGVMVLPLDGRAALKAPAHAALIHWPEYALSREQLIPALVGMAQSLGKVAILRARGVPVVWTAHNLAAHGGRHPRLERAFWLVLQRLVSAHIQLSRAGTEATGRRLPALARKPHVLVPHPHYRDQLSPARPAAEVRRLLGLAESDITVGMVGQLASYKGCIELARTFVDTPSADLRLVLAGPADETVANELNALAERDPRIVLRTTPLSAEDVQDVTVSLDLVVLPYRQIFNSGSVIHALSVGRPVLVPNTPVLAELAEEVGDGWISFFSTPPGLTPVDLSEAADRARVQRGRPGPSMEARTWAGAARATKAFLGELAR